MLVSEKAPQAPKARSLRVALLTVALSGLIASLCLFIAPFQTTASRTYGEYDRAIEEWLRKTLPQLLGAHETRVFPTSGVTGLTSDGRMALNFSAVRDGRFKPEYKQLQWIQELVPANADKATYVLTEDVEGHTSYVIRSLVDDSFQYVLYNDSSFQYGGVEYEISNLVASPDLEKALLKTNSTKSWRHSSFALYWLLDVKKNTIEPLLGSTEHKVAVTRWSPALSHVAYVYDNNVYVRDLTQKEPFQVTFDGSADLFYGKPDWVYEEEVFSADSALWWLPTGSKLAFLKTNDTLVPEYTIPYYVQDGFEDYPEMVSIKYPKAGYSNPVVDVVVVDITEVTKGCESGVFCARNDADNAILVTEMASSLIKDRLITEVVWVADELLLVKTSNRASDILEVYLISAATNNAKLVRSHAAKDSWFEITSNTLYIPRNASVGRPKDGYIDTVVVDGYNHLAYFLPPENPEGVLLTSGRWEVVGGVLSFDYTNNDLFFVATHKSSVERHIYSVNLAEAIASSSRLPGLRNITDTSREGWFSGSFSSGSRYLLLTNQGPDVPSQRLVDLYADKTVQIVSENKEITKEMQRYALPERLFGVVNLGKDDSGDDVLANYVETFPLDFDPYKQYPVLFFVYGGPNSQTVQKTFSVSFSSVVAAELNAIVVTVDGRGTGFNNHNKNGANFKFTVRDRLGLFEPLDQIAAAKVWASKAYVDETRIAIWGWSYGGFLALKTLETDDEHVFSYGVSIAPVTRWKLYDSIYTERYLSEPQANPKGYETASIHNVTNFRGKKRFFIGHGSGDDNVHHQNSLVLLDKFNLEGVENYDYMLFPDSDHSISFHNANTVVYDRILRWLRSAFSGKFEAPV